MCKASCITAPPLKVTEAELVSRREEWLHLERMPSSSGSHGCRQSMRAELPAALADARGPVDGGRPRDATLVCGVRPMKFTAGPMEVPMELALAMLGLLAVSAHGHHRLWQRIGPRRERCIFGFQLHRDANCVFGLGSLLDPHFFT